jgi:uncharacterized protein YjbI with pentapeptide repeats
MPSRQVGLWLEVHATCFVHACAFGQIHALAFIARQPNQVLNLAKVTFKSINEDLHQAALSYADLSHAKMSGANLSGLNLQRAKLSGANLTGKCF